MNNIPQHFLDKIREAKELRLTQLDLSLNWTARDEDKLTKIPEEVFELEWLEVLTLNYNHLTSVPESITRLVNLTELDLRNNGLTTLPESITCLVNLTRLYLSSNGLTTLPESITRLVNLTVLGLSSNGLTTLPESITRLVNLTVLGLSSNGLTTLPESITRLVNLTVLGLSNNGLTILPESITRLVNLRELDLSYNRLTTLPESITRLVNLKELDLRNNPLETPPLEVAKQGIEAIREYFRQKQEEGEDTLYEAKLLIIGEGGAGKTSLAKKIENPDYELTAAEDSTQGIDIKKWVFTRDNQDYRVNIWDFGGQEIYHQTHQFFLTKRSLYVLVADNRKEDTDFYYWLNVVELFSDNSPLLIIKNEKQDRQREINDRQLRGDFTNLKEILPTNLATNRGLDDILTHIKDNISKLPHIGSTLPKTWTRVRDALEKDPRNYISLEEYLSLCENNGFKQRKRQLQLSQFLHDIGVILHFQDSPTSLLYKTVILKPEWGTAAVYKVLDDQTVINNFGRFREADLSDIWQQEDYNNMQGELLALMMRFNLCYKVPNSQVTTYIAPQLLNRNPPKYNWKESNNLILRYTYDFMPKGIISRFIVEMNGYIEQQKYVWKEGVILNKDETKAEVIENYGKREIKIRVVGKYKRDLMTTVTYELDKIHQSYHQLKYKKLIPCNCGTCKDSQEPHFYDYEKGLKWFIENRQPEIQCQKSFQMVNVQGLIDDVMDSQKLSKQQEEEKAALTTFVNIEKQINIHNLKGNVNMEEYPQKNIRFKSAWANGLFYLFIFVVVVALIGFLAGSLPVLSLGLVIIAGILFVPLIGALQLRQDDRLSEKSFLELMKMVIGQLPLIGNMLGNLLDKK